MITDANSKMTPAERIAYLQGFRAGTTHEHPGSPYEPCSSLEQSWEYGWLCGDAGGEKKLLREADEIDSKIACEEGEAI